MNYDKSKNLTIYFRTKIFVLVLLLAYGNAHGAEPAHRLELSLKAACVSNHDCIFTGRPILVNIDITNDSAVDISCALELLEALGPYTTLVDRASGQKLSINAGLPLGRLALTELRRGESWALTMELNDFEIKHFRKSNIDLDANFLFSVPGETVSPREKIVCFGNTTIRVKE